MNNAGMIILIIVWFIGLVVPAIWIQFGKEEEKGQQIGLAMLYCLIYFGVSYLLLKIFVPA